MRSTLYVDDYGLIDTAYVVHAFPLNPYEEHPTDSQEWCSEE
jgi:hypothetical protein